MTTEFIYSITDDMPDGEVNNIALIREIRASSITQELGYVSVDGDELKIAFKTDLTAGEETVLDGDTTSPAGGLLAAHGKDLRILSNSKYIATRDEAKTSSSLSYSTYCSLRVDDLAQGDYRISWYAEFGGRNANAIYSFRIHYPQGSVDLSEVSIKPGMANVLSPMSGFAFLTGVSRGPFEICMQMKVDDNRTSVMLQNARITLEYVDIVDDSNNPDVIQIYKR